MSAATTDQMSGGGASSLENRAGLVEENDGAGLVPKTLVDDEGVRDERDGPARTDDDNNDEDNEDDHLAWARGLSWLRRPDERWLRPLVLLLATGSGMIIGPRIELGTQLICEELLGVEQQGSWHTYASASMQTPTSSFSSWLATLVNLLPPPHERPPLSDTCRRSPAVEAGYIALALRLSLTLGILSVLTTGFWGGLSDRRGRTPILRLSVLGLIFSDLSYIALGLFPQTSVPFGKNLLVVGIACEGALGGLATLMAAHMAYISDVTPSGTRATVFSFFTGMFFCGFALGPSLGGLLAKRMRSNMVPFYFALAAHVIYLVFATLFLPESKNPERMRKAQSDYYRTGEDADIVVGQAGQVGLRRFGTAAKKSLFTLSTIAAAPLQPLLLLMPHRRHDNHIAAASPQTASSRTARSEQAAAFVATDDVNGFVGDAAAYAATHRIGAPHISVSQARPRALDWNLTLVALAYFLETSLMGIVTPKINYAMYKFNWDIEEIGYFLSFSSLTRVACLTIIFPLFVKLVHRRVSTDDGDSARHYSEAEEGRPLLDDDGRLTPSASPVLPLGRSYGATAQTHLGGNEGDANDDVEEAPSSSSASTFYLGTNAKYIERLWMLRGRHLQQLHDSRFDRQLVLGSLAVAVLSYTLLAALSDAGPGPFIALSALASLGGAASAGLSSLALALLDSNKDAGKFFAAWSVLSAVSQTIVGPIIFSTVFVHTVSSAPQTIFLVGVAILISSALAVAMIRVRTVRSLPALPPRPHANASRRTAKAATAVAATQRNPL